VKPGARILGVDDAGHSLDDTTTEIIGVVHRGTEFIEDVRFGEVDVDGNDATQSVIQLHKRCKNTKQIAAVVVDGISVAGFNLVDIREVSDTLEKPIIASTPNQPDRDRFRKTMEETGNADYRIQKIPDFRELEVEDGTMFFQAAGCTHEEAKEILRSSLIHGLTPEPVRAAHLIGRGIHSHSME
jgi:endonuclease V-like protein UPF0215 family